MAKKIIFDSGPLINFAMNGSLYILERLKKEFNIEFLITKEVRQEIIDTPLTIKRFELEALQLKSLYDKGIIKLANITPLQVDELRKKRDNLMNIANSTFKTKKRHVHLIDKGEAAVLALAGIIKPDLIVIDERTTRMLCENPENLRKLLEKKLHSSITANRKNYSYFEHHKIIRSTELAYIAYKKSLFDIRDSRALEAMLYGLKYRGCSISEAEVEEMKSL
jgi:predicted nucleic acid-binding protein